MDLKGVELGLGSRKESISRLGLAQRDGTFDRHTSGNVPLEKTLSWQKSVKIGRGKEGETSMDNSHEQAGLAACTIANNDELATNLRHGKLSSS